MQEVEERERGIVIRVEVSHDGSALCLEGINRMIAEEVEQISACEVSVLETVDALEAGVRLEVR